MKKWHSKKGFTLVELLIVVAIIAILIAIGIPAFSTVMERSRETVDIANIRAAYAEYMADELMAQQHKAKTNEVNDVSYTKVFKLPIRQKKIGWLVPTNDLPFVSDNTDKFLDEADGNVLDGIYVYFIKGSDPDGKPQLKVVKSSDAAYLDAANRTIPGFVNKEYTKGGSVQKAGEYGIQASTDGSFPANPDEGTKLMTAS